MSFLYPLGLIGLVGVPILIIIYIIKSKYSEQTVASTYLWELSERFLKRRRPVSPLAGIISLILQILIVTLVSLAVAHPTFVVKGSANEYYLLLDASGSMSAEVGGESRFDRAKSEALNVIDSAVDGSRYTVVLMGDLTSVVLDSSSDKREARECIEALRCADGEADVAEAIFIAARGFADDKTQRTYLFTDTAYDGLDNVNVVNVSEGAKNAAIHEAGWDISAGKLTAFGNVSLYHGEGTVTVQLFANGSATPLGEAVLTLADGESAPFSITTDKLAFNSLELRLVGEDSLAIDNGTVMYDVRTEDTSSVLLISDTPFFFKTVLEALGHNKITVISPDEYSSAKNGYGLYIFDCCTPSAMPTDGAVWFVDPQGSVQDSGFSVQGDALLERGEEIELTTSSGSLARTLTKGIEGDGIEIIEYVRCSLYRAFTPVFLYNGNPILFAGTNSHGHREVVFAFDIHNSNLPLLVDFVVLLDNLMSFSFPSVVEKTDYTVGDTAGINVVANCESIRVDSPRGEVTYLSTDTAVSELMLTECGTYKITVTVSKIPREYYIYASVPESESEPLPIADLTGIPGVAEAGGFDGSFDPVYIILILLGVLFLADWGLYCYEKYQLR